MEIDIRFLIKEIPKSKWSDAKCVIAAPENRKELDGYGIIINSGYVKKTKGSLVFLRAQEFDKITKAPVFVFEKLEKVAGKRFPYKKYTVDECKQFYEKCEQPNLLEEIRKRQYKKSGAGVVAWCKYNHSHIIGMGEVMAKVEQRYDGWYVFPQNDFDYAYKIGSGNNRFKIKVQELSIIHEYGIEDVSKVFENMDYIAKLVSNNTGADIHKILDEIRENVE